MSINGVRTTVSAITENLNLAGTWNDHGVQLGCLAWRHLNFSAVDPLNFACTCSVLGAQLQQAPQICCLWPHGASCSRWFLSPADGPASPQPAVPGSPWQSHCREMELWLLHIIWDWHLQNQPNFKITQKSGFMYTKLNIISISGNSDFEFKMFLATVAAYQWLSTTTSQLQSFVHVFSCPANLFSAVTRTKMESMQLMHQFCFLIWQSLVFSNLLET